MSETEGSSAEDHAYFQAVEAVFLRLRGAPLLLTPADWQVARDWRRRNIPLELVVRTVEDLYARRAARGGSKRRINTLRYFGAAVENAWEELRALTGPGHVLAAPPLDVPARLSALAEALPEALPARAEWAGRMTALSGRAEEVERSLAALDAELLEAIEAGLDGAGRGELDTQIERIVLDLGRRLPKEEVQSARERLRRQLLRQRADLPILSLFTEPVATVCD